VPNFRRMPPSPAVSSRRELALVVFVCYALFALLIVATGNYKERIRSTGDNPSYAQESAALRGAVKVNLARHFVGLPLLTAPLAAILPIDDYDAIAAVSILASAGAVAVAADLWGVWAAAWFALVNLDWIQRSMLGGAEPLFALLIFAALLAARRERFVAAATLASLATIVRPLGIFLLVALGITLLGRRRWRELALAVGISVVVGGAYLLIVRAAFGAPLSNLAWYHSMGLGHDRTFIPFVTLPMTYAEGRVTWKVVLKTSVWMLFTAAAIFAALRRREIRALFREHPVEWLFAAIYFASFFTFPAWWIEGEFPRYLVPVIPLLLIALRPWLPEDRRIVWAVGIFSVSLAALEDVILR
jgi:hypothetical protein